jgi:hypothetical protein
MAKTHPEAQARMDAIAEHCGVKTQKSQVFGETIEYNDGSKVKDGVWGRTYYFQSDKKTYKPGVHGWDITGGSDPIGAVQVGNDNVQVNHFGGSNRSVRVGGNMSNTVISTGRNNIISSGGSSDISVGDGRTMINGKDYTGRIPAGASIEVREDGTIYADGQKIE